MTNLPSNLEIEQSILASCLLHQDDAELAASVLTPEDFYSSAHSLIFKTVCDLVSESNPVDARSVAGKIIESCGDLKKCGGATYLVTLIETAPYVVSMDYAAQKLRTYTALRKTMATCQKTIAECAGANGNALDVVNRCKDQIAEITADPPGGMFVTMAQLTEESADRYEDMAKRGIQHGVMSGFKSVDSLTGGFRGPKLIIVAARPGIGKTALMCNMVKNIAEKGEICGVFELEMDKSELDDRWNAALSGIDSSKLTTGIGMTAEDWRKLHEAFGRKHRWPVIINDTGGLDMSDIKALSRQMVKKGAKIIFIDQLSKISGNRKLTIWERNTEHVEELGFLKKELGVPIVLLAQLNREVEKRSDKEPMLSDLKNTGQLEEEADMVFLGYRPFVYSDKPEDEHKAQWHLAKHRNGPTMKIQMFWNSKQTTFFDIATHALPPADQTNKTRQSTWPAR